MTPTSRPLALTALAVLALTLAGQAQEARPGWRLGGGLGVFRVDELVGSPAVPTFTIAKAGARLYVGLDVAGYFSQGFYGADFLVGDLDIGVSVPLGRTELLLAAGPSGYAGGDGDGTPYTGGGGQASVGLTAWLGKRLGLATKARAHAWGGTVTGVRLGVSAGIVLRL
ncbi:MAG: hypothetical protein AB7R55_07105 [Gemmatimonadales bacterium]